MDRNIRDQRAKSVFRGASAVLAGLFLLILCTSAPCASPDETDVKAAFLFNFLKFVSWGPNIETANDAPIVLGVLEGARLHESLSRMVANKSVRGRPLVTRTLDHDSLAGADIDLLYIGCGDAQKIKAVLELLEGKQVLTVGNYPGFARMGGIIGFTRSENRVHFEINVRAARKAGLDLSSKLLNLAVVINE